MSDKLYNKIAIIPAKKDSIRLPNKNIKEIDNKMLFLYSVEYAIDNNFIPVVSTNSDIEITDSAKGVILKSPGGSKYRVTVTDAGELVTTLV